MTSSTPVDAVVIRPRVTAHRLRDLGVIPVAVVVLLVVLPEGPAMLAMLGGAVAGGVAEWSRRRRQGLVLTVRGLELRAFRRSVVVPWHDLAGIVTTWLPLSIAGPSGLAIRLVPGPGVAAPRVPNFLFRREARARLRSYVERNRLPVPVDPEPPWRDRFGRWHGPLFEFDPEESIASIRRAAVGPWLIRIVPDLDGHRAVASCPSDPARVHRGPRRRHRPEAIRDGRRFVRAARRQSIVAGRDGASSSAARGPR